MLRHFAVQTVHGDVVDESPVTDAVIVALRSVVAERAFCDAQRVHHYQTRQKVDHTNAIRSGEAPRTRIGERQRHAAGVDGETELDTSRRSVTVVFVDVNTAGFAVLSDQHL